MRVYEAAASPSPLLVAISLVMESYGQNTTSLPMRTSLSRILTDIDFAQVIDGMSWCDWPWAPAGAMAPSVVYFATAPIQR